MKTKWQNVTIVFLFMATSALGGFVALNWTKLDPRARAKPAMKKVKSHADEGTEARAEVMGAVRTKSGELQKCYESHLKDRPDVREGTVRISWRIDGDGRVDDVAVEESDFGDGALHSCVLTHIRAWAFEPPSAPQAYAHRFTFRQRSPANLQFE